MGRKAGGCLVVCRSHGKGFNIYIVVWCQSSRAEILEIGSEVEQWKEKSSVDRF